MTLLIVLLLLLPVTATAGYKLRDYLSQQRAKRARDQARLRVIENQLAGLRVAQRIRVAEHHARRRIRTLSPLPDAFAHSTIHEEPEEWR